MSNNGNKSTDAKVHNNYQLQDGWMNQCVTQARRLRNKYRSFFYQM